MFRRTFLLSLLVIILFILTFSSLEGTRFFILEYYLKKKDFQKAIKIAHKIFIKRKTTGLLNKTTPLKTFVLLETAYTKFIEEKIIQAKKKWDLTRSFFEVYQVVNEEIIPVFKEYKEWPNMVDKSKLSEQIEKLLRGMKPYSFEIGFLQNDLSPETGALTFGHSGGVALDCRLRSIGANLDIRRPVAAIFLRRWEKETRVKPKNLSIWLSDDNQFYHRYHGKMAILNEDRKMIFDKLEIYSQYIKIHCDFKDDNYTFAEDFKKILEIFGPPDFNFTLIQMVEPNL